MLSASGIERDSSIHKRSPVYGSSSDITYHTVCLILWVTSFLIFHIVSDSHVNTCSDTSVNHRKFPIVSVENLTAARQEGRTQQQVAGCQSIFTGKASKHLFE